MSNSTFVSAGDTYDMTVNSAFDDGRKYPVVVFVHGNFGLGPPFGDQIFAFAKKVADRGYNTAVPHYYLDNRPHLDDTTLKVQTLTDAIDAVSGLATVDPARVAIVGFSLGAATAMSFIASKPPGTTKALADFYGFLNSSIRAAVAKFPPTMIFHNKNDVIVDVDNSRNLDTLLPNTVPHQYVEYDERHLEVNHSFKPGGQPDTDSQSKTVNWLETHLPASAT